MFTRVLIANRGEIAVRVIRTLHELGIEAVAVYSTADRGALHTRLADRAICIGPPPAAESYLSIPSVDRRGRDDRLRGDPPRLRLPRREPGVRARVRRHRSSSSSGRARRSWRRWATRCARRRRWRAAGVPVVPGTEGVATAAEARAAADDLGYPVLLKAAAGGGGKGMRLVSSPAELGGTFQTASIEALAAFGDGRVYVEKALVPARHVEVQVLADG